MLSFFSKKKKQRENTETENKMQMDTAQRPAQEPMREPEGSYDEYSLNTDDALNHLLHTLHGNMGSDDRIEDKHLFIPAWDLTITPQISQLTENSAVINFYLSSSRWDREVFECCAGMGKSPKQALGMATGSFLFAFIQGIAQMEEGREGEALETVFAGKVHRWHAYVSDIVGMGDSPKTEGPKIYWNALKDEIVKRLGNQKLCYIKVYGANNNGQITAECRINDIVSEELSAQIAKMVEKWNVKNFASHKQFFFIRQEEETTLPDTYSGPEGLKLLKCKVKTAVEMFHASTDQALYDSLPQRLEQALGDKTLAAECYSFLPEICAENAFPQITYSESVEIRAGGQPPVTCYKVQLADYWNLHRVLFELFQEGVFGEETNTIYQEYISVSSVYGIVKQIIEKEGQLKEGGKLTMLLFEMGEGFEIR